MKKKLSMIAALVLMVGICAVSDVMPASADAGINSHGNISLANGDVAIYSDDIARLQSQMVALSSELPQEKYASEAEMTSKSDLKSKGSINFDDGKVVFDDSDLISLADGLDNIDKGYKYEIEKNLNQIGTYHTADGGITYNSEAGAISPSDASKLNFETLCEGIAKSQSVEHLAASNIRAATAENLTNGTAAWVNGKLIIGNGSDTEMSYDRGFEDGGGWMPKQECYFLGVSHTYTVSGEIYYNIGEQVPEINCRGLTEQNFIVCPLKVKGNSYRESKYLSIAADVSVYSRIPEAVIPIETHYYPNYGILLVKPPTISASGGLDSKKGFGMTATSDLSVCVYLIKENVVDRAVPEGNDRIVEFVYPLS